MRKVLLAGEFKSPVADAKIGRDAIFHALENFILECIPL